MNIEIQTQEPNIVLESLFQKIDCEIGDIASPTKDAEFELIDSGSQNLLGTTTVWVILKILSIKMTAEAQTILLGVIANLIFETLKKLSNPILKMNNKVVPLDEEQIKFVITEYIKQSSEEE